MMKNGVNCGNPKQQSCKAIRSEADQEWPERSETRAWSPDRTVKPHECAATSTVEEIVPASARNPERSDKEPTDKILNGVFALA